MSGPIVPTTPGGAKPSAPSGQIVQIVSLPEGLQNNARAIRIEGEVIQQNKDGSVRVRTPEGDIDINVRGKQPQPGAKIEVDIPAGNPPRQATIRPAPLPPPALPLPQTPAPTTSVPVPPAPLPQTPVTSSQPPVTTTPGQTPDTPDIYQPQPPSNAPVTTKSASAPPAPLPPLEPGQEVKLVPLPDIAPQDAPEPTTIPKVTARTNIIVQKAEGNFITTLLQAMKSVLPQSAQPANTVPASIIGKTPMPMVTTQPALQMPANISVQPLVLPAKIVSLILPSGQVLTAPNTIQAAPAAPAIPTPAVSNASAPQMTFTPPATPLITVTVMQVTPQQQPIITIPMNDKGAVQNFVLQSPPASVPIGTQVTLQPLPMQGITTPTQIPTTPQQTVTTTQTSNVQIAPPATMLPPAWRGFLPLMQPASLWPIMDEMFQTFYQATPQAAQILGRIIPSPANAANFGPAVLLFAAALKSGELQAWMGDKKLEMLQKLGKDSILSRLSREASSLSGNIDTPATDWKSFPVPMLWQNEISKVMFHVRQEAQDNNQENKEGTTRFVLDLSLTRMGEVQLDGTVNGKRLDVIVRTQIPVSMPMQESMKVAYAKALEGSDIYGELGFQGDMKNRITVRQAQHSLGVSA